MRIDSENPPRELWPGKPAAIAEGCTCKQNQTPVGCRDGVGFDIHRSCPLHGHWKELAE